MQERSAKSRGWVSGLLRAGKAAAFLTLATGINGVVSAYLPRYEPIYVYLIAVVVVGLTGGLLLGVTTAVAAVIVYDWMFSPLHVVPSVSSVVPLTVAVLAAVASRAAQLSMRPRAMLAEPAQPPLLSPAPAVHPVAVIDDERVAELEEDLAAARAAVEKESRLRNEANAAARVREAQLQHELELLRTRSTEQTGRSGEAEHELKAMAAKLADTESRVASLHQELDVAWRKADEERVRADREAGLRGQVEVAGRESIQQTVADLSARHETALAVAMRRASETAATVSAAQEELAKARQAIDTEKRRTADQEAAVAVARAEAEKLRSKAEKLRVHLEEERGRAAREAEMRQGLQSSAREQLEQSIRQISGTYETELAAARQRIEAKEARIADLQKALDSATIILQDERVRSERESTRRAQLEMAARETLQRTADVAAEHQRVAAEAQERAALAEQRAAAAEKQLGALRTTFEQGVTERQTAARNEVERLSRQSLQQAAGKAAAAEQRALELESELADFRARVDRMIAERESSVREQLELSARETLQQALGAAAIHERLSAEAQQKAAAAEQRAATLQNHLDLLRSDVDRTLAETQAHSESIEAELVRVRSIVEAETARADRETDLREQAEAAAQRSQALIAETSARYESALERIRAENETERTASSAAREQALSLQAELSTLRQQLVDARAERQRLMTDFDEKMQAIVVGITTDHENAIGEAMVEKEGARAEIRSLTAKLQKLQDEVRSAGGGDQRLQNLLAETSAKYERALAAMRQQLANARAELETQRALHEATVAESDRKLQAIVAGITTDQEHALGEALVDKEAARAEVRTLSTRLQDLQHKLLSFDEVQARVQRANDQLQTSLAEARSTAEQERRAREKSEAEWNQKLQNIVSHLASDHESDVGEAMLAKEGARAEARNLAAKVAALQERLESDREKFRSALEKWSKERASLLERIKTAESTAPVQRSAPTIEEPLPPVGPRRSQPLVLVVHSDAGIRAMSKHTLEQAGYTILTAADGLEGLRMATQQRPDVVIAQAVMPKMNGRELIQLLKSRPETAAMKIVLLSGSETHDSERGADFRPDDVVPNIADLRALRDALENVLSAGGRGT